MYEFSGEVVKVCPTRAVGQKQRLKREIWVKELPEGKFANTFPFVLKGDRCKMGDSLSVGDEVKVSFVLEGNVWDKRDGTEPRCFGNGVCLKLEVTSASKPRDLPMSGGYDSPQGGDDMPF